MAQAFSIKNYFKKIYSPDVLVEFYKQHDIVALFEITDSTPRKNAVSAFVEFYNALPPEHKIDIEKEFALIASISTKYSAPIFSSILKEKKLPEITQIECESDHDKVLYHYMFNREVFDDALFFHDFYSSRGYMLYEAGEVTLTETDLALTELKREFTRIANKDDNATECDFEHKTLDKMVYFAMTYDGKPIISAKKSVPDDGEVTTKTTRKQETVKIVYLPTDKEILISFTGGKYEKLIFLDTFLRIVCKSGYEGKVELFDLSSFSQHDFDFTKTNKGLPLLTWKLKATTLSFGGTEKSKKKMKLMIPSTPQEHGLAPLFSTLEEIGIVSDIKSYGVENVSLTFSFINSQKPDKSIPVACSLSKGKSSLCPLFPYDRIARTLLKQAGIEQGFVEPEKKAVEDVSEKWEV
jgi:hypothetical protein